jgi:hypothetical protein
MNNIKLSAQNSNNKTLKRYLKDICVLDTTYRKKHDMLNKLYNDFMQKNILLNNNASRIDIDGESKKELIIVLDDLNNQIRNNNEDLYRHRMNVVKYIKNDNILNKDDKKSVSDYLINMFNKEVSQTSDMKCCLEPYYNTVETQLTDIKVVDLEIKKERKGVKVDTLDKAYLQKHNELAQMFKAYQILYKRVGEYKAKLDNFSKLSSSQLISEDNMKRMLDDQKYMMETVNKMQEDLVSRRVLDPEERIPIPIEPIVKHPNNLKMFNNGIKEQINMVIEKNKNVELDEKTKHEIIRMIENKVKGQQTNKSKLDEIIMVLNKNNNK